MGPPEEAAPCHPDTTPGPAPRASTRLTDTRNHLPHYDECPHARAPAARSQDPLPGSEPGADGSPYPRRAPDESAGVHRAGNLRADAAARPGLHAALPRRDAGGPQRNAPPGCPTPARGHHLCRPASVRHLRINGVTRRPLRGPAQAAVMLAVAYKKGPVSPLIRAISNHPRRPEKPEATLARPVVQT